jgi:L-seryl-tRNA(Ser) seleniumtransferase
VGRGDAAADELNARLRALPAIDRLAGRLEVLGAPAALATAAARVVVEARRDELLAGATDDPDLLVRALGEITRGETPSLRRVLNATGVIVHTNLGRAPLAASARAAVARIAEGSSNLELDLDDGRRGSRHAHVEGLLRELTGAEAGFAVNNCAAAVLLAAAALAGDGREVVVSRGQLVEIGGSFRIPDVVGQSGATLVEVGTTNRTRLADYEHAVGERTGAILRAHPSNFRTVGFVEEVGIEELCALGVPVIDDAGSGVLAGGVPLLEGEPPIRRSVAAGAALVCFSGDKLLGGPQAGVLVGRAGAVEAARRHPLARALRIDKLSLAALEATLRLYRDPGRARREIPVLRMLEAPEAELAARAARLHDALHAAGVDCVVDRAVARVGGGALPLLELEGPVVALAGGRPDDLAARLRAGEPPLVGRINDGRLLLDPRTLADDEVDAAAVVVARASTAG